MYGQHWYWYATARILALNGSGILYLPKDFTWSLGITDARSAFPGTGAQWQPSRIPAWDFLWRIGRGVRFRGIFYSRRAPKISRRWTRLGISRPIRMVVDCLSICQVSGRDRLRRLSKAHARKNRHYVWVRLWHPFLKNSGDSAQQLSCSRPFLRPSRECCGARVHSTSADIPEMVFREA